MFLAHFTVYCIGQFHTLKAELQTYIKKFLFPITVQEKIWEIGDVVPSKILIIAAKKIDKKIFFDTETKRGVFFNS